MLLCLGSVPAIGQDTATITGRVVSGGEPVPGANVVLTDSSASEVSPSTARFGSAAADDGRFRIDDVPAGTYRLVVSAVGFRRHTERLEVNAGETVEVDVEITPRVDPLEELVVSGRKTLTQPSTAVTAARLRLVPGGTNLVDLGDRNRRSTATLADALEAESGVVVQEFFGGNDQPRISVRGSGIQSNPQSRGMLLMHNGFPVNFADGSFVAGIIEPRLAQHAAVYRGSNALRHGGAALGGVLNLVAPTGRGSAGPRLKLTRGSYDTWAGHGQYAWAGEQTDGFAAVTGHRHDGFRRQNDRGTRLVGHTNWGYQWSPALETRLYGTGAMLEFDIPGPLNKAQLNGDPRSVSEGVTPPSSLGPNVPVDQPRRETDLYRLATRTTWSPPRPEGAARRTLDLGLVYQYTDDIFYFPVGTGMRDVQSHDLTLDLQFDRAGSIFGTRGATALGGSATIGWMDRAFFGNERGVKGRMFADNDMQATTLRLYAEQTFRLADRWTLTAGAQGVMAPRTIDEAFGTPAQRPRYVVPKDTYAKFSSGETDFSETYWGFNPTLGLRFEVRPTLSVFGNVARSFEPPTFNTLLSPRGGSPKAGPSQFQVQPLEAQRATTVEVGTRRNAGRLQWDVAAYRTWLQNELLTTSAIFGGSGETSNAPVRTIHQGIEAQLTARVLEGVLTRGAEHDRLTLQTAYTGSDFFFDTSERNQLAGVPRHWLQGQLTYAHPAGLTVGPTLTWMPERTPTDHANTVYQDSYALWGARISYQTPSSWLQGGGRVTVFAEARNLGDVAYASSYLVRDRVPSPPPEALSSEDVTTFIPGRGQTLRIGLTAGW